jgi:hypothetical protein
MKLARLTLVVSFLGFAACADLTGPDTPAISADEASNGMLGSGSRGHEDPGFSGLSSVADDGERTQLGSGGRAGTDNDGDDEQNSTT